VIVSVHELPIAPKERTSSITGSQLARVRATVVGGVVGRGVVGVGAGATVGVGVGAGAGEAAGAAFGPAGATATTWVTPAVAAVVAAVIDGPPSRLIGSAPGPPPTAAPSSIAVAGATGVDAPTPPTPPALVEVDVAGAGCSMASAAMIVQVAARLSPRVNAREAGAAEDLGDRRADGLERCSVDRMRSDPDRGVSESMA
jgi:hypothetical protein